MNPAITPATGGQHAIEAPVQGHTFRLLRYFSITAGIAILLVALVFTWTYYRKEVNDQIEASEARNVVMAQTFANSLWPSTHGKLVGRVQIDPRVLRETVSSMSRRVPVTKIKIYDPSGIAIFSSAEKEIGEDDSANPAFRLALAGKVISELTLHGEVSRSEGSIEKNDVVSTYIPITGENGQIHSVFELYSDVTETLLRVRQATLRLLFGLVGIFAALYAVLLIIVGSADKILRRQYRSLKENEDLIRAKNLALQSEIEARISVEGALRSSEKAAASANRAKTEFLSNMSHELRTPMNAILGFAQLSLSEPAEPLGTNQRKFIGQIVKAGKHLLALINEVLDLARIEAGKIELSVEAVSIANVANECLPLIENMARDLNVRVQPFEAITSRTVMADYIRLKQVLLNLLSNAVKYNRAGGEVSLTATHVKPDRIRLNVIDTGVGIPESVRGSLFQPFQRLVAESSVVEGTGIGLALAKKLVIAMGGEIGFDSVEGTGSTFWIELPIAPEAIEGVAAFGPREQIRNSKHIEKSSILYIEDNPANVMLMEHVAARMAITFATAHNAELGIALAGKMMPNLIIMDINLPQMDGYEALKCLKKNPDTASIPVIALSASAMENEVARGKAAGFVEYHTKPIDVDEIAAAISRLTGAHS